MKRAGWLLLFAALFPFAVGRMSAQDASVEELPLVSALPAGSSGEVSPIEAPANEQTATKPSFSLTELLGRFFELGAPGDPNHPDKLRLTASTTLGYDDNVFTTNTDPIASATASLAGNLGYNFGSDRLKLAASLSGGATYYDNRPGDKTDYNGAIRASASYFVTRRLQLNGNVAFAYLSQPNPTLIGGVTRFSGDYSTANLGFDLTYNLVPRLAVQLGYSLSAIRYADDAQNESLGFVQQTYSVSLDYLLTPRFTLTSEYRYVPLSYYEADQDSAAHILTVGFQTRFSPKFSWTLQGGAETRVLANATPGDSPEDYIGPFLESNLSYEFRPGSQVLGTLRYGSEPSGVAGISIRQTFRGALSFRYAFSPRLVGDLGLSYQHDNFDQPGNTADFTQTYYTGSLGLRFQINPALTATAAYSYSAVQSENTTDEYTRNITTVGLEIIF